MNKVIIKIKTLIIIFLGIILPVIVLIAFLLFIYAFIYIKTIDIVFLLQRSVFLKNNTILFSQNLSIIRSWMILFSLLYTYFTFPFFYGLLVKHLYFRKSKKKKDKSSIKNNYKALKLAIAIIVFVIPILLSVCEYVRISESAIYSKQLISFTVQKYTWDEVKFVEIKAVIKKYTSRFVIKEYFSPQMFIDFGTKKIEIWQNAQQWAPFNKDLFQFIDFARSHVHIQIYDNFNEKMNKLLEENGKKEEIMSVINYVKWR